MSTPPENWRRAARRRFTALLGVLVVGTVLAAVASGALQIVGVGLLAVAFTVAVSLVFLEIGYSEDRARARERDGGR